MNWKTAFLCFMFALIGCTAPPSPTAAPAPTIAYTMPAAGKTTIVGHVVSFQTRQGLPQTVVRLAEVFREGEEAAYVLDGAFSPGDITDEHGNFIFENVDAREYVIVVGDIYDKYVVIPDTSGKAKVWVPKADEVLNIGDLFVELP